MGETASKGKEPKKSSFFAGLKAEFNKIVWPNRDDVSRQTVVVVVCSVFLGLIIALLDMVMKIGLIFILK